MSIIGCLFPLTAFQKNVAASALFKRTVMLSCPFLSIVPDELWHIYSYKQMETISHLRVYLSTLSLYFSLSLATSLSCLKGILYSGMVGVKYYFYMYF